MKKTCKTCKGWWNFDTAPDMGTCQMVRSKYYGKHKASCGSCSKWRKK